MFNFTNFFKNQIEVETRLDELHFISWAQIQKISFYGEISSLEQGTTTSPNTLK